MKTGVKMKGILFILFMVSILVINNFAMTENPCGGTAANTVWCLIQGHDLNCGKSSCNGTGQNGTCGVSPAGCTQNGSFTQCHDCNLQ